MRCRVPDAITISRMVAALLLLGVVPFSAGWCALYLWCGISDGLDGWLARYLKVGGAAGARLDSIADLVFVVSVLASCAPVLPWTFWMVAWIGAIAVVRLISLLVCHCRFGVCAFLHTGANKAAGAVLFLFPAAYLLWGLPSICVVVCAVASLSAAEELLLMARMPLLDRDVRSIVSLGADVT